MAVAPDGSESTLKGSEFSKAKHGIVLNTPFSPTYTGGGTLALIDGINGSFDFGDGKWQGYEGIDLDAVVDLGVQMPVTKISTGFLQNVASWIFFPKTVEYSVSSNGKDFQTVSVLKNDIPDKTEEARLKSFSAELNTVTARYIKVHAKSIEVCPDWHPGKGGKAWIFADEIEAK